jgi:AraC family transcriptional activator of pobA
MRTGKKNPAHAVPIFSLYGEQELMVDAVSPLEFVHIESIAARSQRYDWEIGSHSHRGLFQLLFLFSGGAQAAIDDASLEIRPPAALCISPAVVHAFRFRPGTHGYVLTFAESLLMGADAIEAALFEPLRSGARMVDLGSSEDVSRVAGLLDQIVDEFRWLRIGRNHVLDWLVRAVLILVTRKLSVTRLSGSARWRADLFASFRGLVEAHLTEHWPMRRYAEVLNVTESRLNRLCLAITGKSAFDVHQDRLLLEARRKLFYIAASVSQVAYELGFSDPAYFCRFFKKNTGIAPSAFRRQEGDG